MDDDCNIANPLRTRREGTNSSGRKRAAIEAFCGRSAGRVTPAGLTGWIKSVRFYAVMQEGDAVARNLITDIPGVRVGHADDAKLGSGSTVVVFDKAVVA